MSSEELTIPVFFKNQVTGQIQEEEFSIPRTATVKDVLKVLKEKFHGEYASLYNAATELQDDALIDDIYEEEDVLTAVPPPPKRSVLKPIENCSDDQVILMDKKQRPIFVQKQNEHVLKMHLLDFSPTLILFRKTDEVSQRERVFKGQKYKIPTDKNMLSIKITQDRVTKISDEGNEEDLEKDGEEVTKLEAFFYRPNGRNLLLEFHNLDENNLYVITGSKLFFESIEIPAGEMKMVNVKSDFKKAHCFGVAAGGQGLNPVTGKRVFSTTMFKVFPGGKMVKINKTSSGYTAILEKSNGTQTKCVQKGAKTFDESQRLCKKEMLKWFKEGLCALAGAAVQGGVEGAC